MSGVCLHSVVKLQHNLGGKSVRPQISVENELDIYLWIYLY